VAYLVPWGSQAAGRFLTAALRADLKVLSQGKAFTQNGRAYPAGTLVLLVKDNPEILHAAVAKLAADSGAEVIATDTGWTEGGINFGSNHTQRLRRVAIALLWDSPAGSSSAGNLRFVLERQFHYPVTAVRTLALANADLSQFHVILLPDGGGYGNVVGGPAGERLHAWVRSGGTLITMGNATAALTQSAGGWLAVQQEALAREGAKGDAKPPEPARPAGAPPAPPSGPVPGKILAKAEDWQKAIQPEQPLPDAVAGVLAKATTDPENWVTAGAAPSVNFMLEGALIITPIKLDKGVNAASFSAPDELVQSGYLWEENRKQLAFKPAVVVQPEGRGNVVGFTTDLTFRAFMDGLNVILLNAVFRAPAPGRGYGE